MWRLTYRQGSCLCCVTRFCLIKVRLLGPCVAGSYSDCCVPNNFPPLGCFALSFLFGQGQLQHQQTSQPLVLHSASLGASVWALHTECGNLGKGSRFIYVVCLIMFFIVSYSTCSATFFISLKSYCEVAVPIGCGSALVINATVGSSLVGLFTNPIGILNLVSGYC